MKIKRQQIRSLLQDAILDREAYLDACRNVPEYLPEIESDLAELRGLASRYDQPKRVVLSDNDRATLRTACICALSWRAELHHANENSGNRRFLRTLQIEIGIARSLMAGLGGRFPDVQGRAVSLDELMSSEIGTRVTEEVVGGVTRRTLKENGELLGVIERDEDQVIRVTLAGGRIVNQPFESIEEAQEWMLGRYSKNQLFTRDPEADEDTGFAFGGNP